MSEPTFYGDGLSLVTISMMWNARITILNSKSLVEMRVRHEEELDKAEFVLIYNQQEHYTSVGTFH